MGKEKEAHMDNQIVDTYHCLVCCSLKPITDFYKDGTDAYGNQKYRNVCKQCEKGRRMLNEKAKRLSISHKSSITTQSIVDNRGLSCKG